MSAGLSMLDLLCTRKQTEGELVTLTGIAPYKFRRAGRHYLFVFRGSAVTLIMRSSFLELSLMTVPGDGQICLPTRALCACLGAARGSSPLRTICVYGTALLFSLFSTSTV